MERLELAISGVERVLHPTAVPPPAWLPAARQQLPHVLEALGAEQTDAGDAADDARALRLARERNRLLRRLRQLTPALAEGCLADDGAGVRDPEELRRLLLRLLHDIAHHHQRVNDLVYDGAWRDVGGSE